MIEAKIIADSVSEEGVRLTTLQLRYPRFIHAEVMTHRVFSRNASSSRAIPVAKMLEQVRNEPAMPIHWGANRPGMQALEEAVAPVILELPIEYDNPSDVPLFTFERTIMSAREAWQQAARYAAEVAEAMSLAGYHKQIVNRILEPFQHISVIVTATEWENFFELRAHEDAQPEIHALALAMRDAMDASTPKLLEEGDWHLPYVGESDMREIHDHIGNPFSNQADKLARKVSAARCCRISYLKHDGTKASVGEELALCERLVGAKPLHASPFEHQATPLMRGYANTFSGNLRGWGQYRKLIEASFGS